MKRTKILCTCGLLVMSIAGGQSTSPTTVPKLQKGAKKLPKGLTKEQIKAQKQVEKNFMDKYCTSAGRGDLECKGRF